MNSSDHLQFEPGLKSLSPEYYTGESAYAQARTEIFFKTWQFACHESQLTEVGDFVAFSVFDQDLFVSRAQDGEIRCFFNVCKHRGHTLVEGSGNKRVIVCPYHAWTYELSGELRGAPGTKNIKNFDGSGICLSGVKVDTFLGFVFVNLDNSAKSIAESFPGVESEVLKLCPQLPDQRFAESYSIVKEANWLVAVENYNECYHCKVAHPTFASGVVDPATYNVAAFINHNNEIVRCLRHSASPQTGAAAWYDTSGSDYGTFFLWPAFGLQLYPSGLVNTYHWRPLGIDRTEVVRNWYSLTGELDETLQKVKDLDLITTVAEDAQLVKKVQRGLNSLGYSAGPLVLNPDEGIESEHSIAALHRWAREAIKL